MRIASVEGVPVVPVMDIIEIPAGGEDGPVSPPGHVRHFRLILQRGVSFPHVGDGILTNWNAVVQNFLPYDVGGSWSGSLQDGKETIQYTRYTLCIRSCPTF